MKKKLAVFCLFLFISSAVFSLDYSAGLGIGLGTNFDLLQTEIDSGKYQQSYNQFNYGALAFFDAQYFVADLSFFGTLTGFTPNDTLKQWTKVDESYLLAGILMGLGFSGKYPFAIREGLTIFPLLGVQLNIGLAQSFAKDYGNTSGHPKTIKAGEGYGRGIDWTNLTFKTGLGGDYALNESLFLRGQLVFDYRLNSILDATWLRAIKDAGNSSAFNTNWGFEIDIAIGIKLGGSSSRSFSDTLVIRDDGPDNDYEEPPRPAPRVPVPTPPRSRNGDVYTPKN
jgi:opacity protein-like surface antigen